MATIYEFLAKKFPEKVNKAIHDEFLVAKSLQGKVVGDHAKTDALCNQAMEIFVEYVLLSFFIVRSTCAQISICVFLFMLTQRVWS